MDQVILIVPPDKKHLVFDPVYRDIFGDLQMGVYVPFSDKDGNWVYKLPGDVAARIQDALPNLVAPDAL